MACVPALAFVAPLHAQAQRASLGRITGEVVDSLFTRGPLADADILIEGLPRVLRTDTRGRFVVDSVPPGTYRIAFFHPTIDRIDLQAATVSVRVLADEAAHARLSTPSPTTVYPQLCGPTARTDAGLIVGVARAVGGDAVVPLARIVAHWDDIVVRNGRVTREQPAVLGRVLQGGGFVLCELPTDAEITVVGVTDDGRRAVTGQMLAGATVTPAVLRIAEALPGNATQSGVVLRPDGSPIVGARITQGTDTLGVRTDAEGRFALSGLPARDGEFRVRGLGFRPVRSMLDTTVRALAVVLDPLSAQELEAVTVSARGAGEAPSEFEQRRSKGGGNFITRADIQRRNPMQLSQMFEGLPGMMVQQTTGRVLNLRGASMSGPCEPLYFVDGASFDVGTGVAPLTVLNPEDVAGIEVYRGVATLPMQYGGSQGACGAILIWTRRGSRTRN
jgi:hypothetical protein